jgi:catechol 2,3-dioxygenase-like lactoylglutathione lyase family enzyme
MAKITTHHYVLAVPDAARTAEFFTQQLGFEPRPVADPGWRFVARDGFMVMLGSCPDAIPPGQLGDHSFFAYLVVDDVDGYFREEQTKGVQGLRPPEDKPWGMREFCIKTPDGHRIMIGKSNSSSEKGIKQ